MINIAYNRILTTPLRSPGALSYTYPQASLSFVQQKRPIADAEGLFDHQVEPREYLG